MFARTFSRDREVAAVYVRHTMASGNWIPGSSDIDLSVILRADLEPEAEFAFLQAFWKRFARLKRIWPMLGEVDLLTERELPAWSMYASRSARPATWRLLGGRAVSLPSTEDPSGRWRIRALKTAYWFYIDRFLPSLDGGSGFLEITDRQRLARKILTLAAGADSLPPAALDTAPGPLLTRVLRALHAATPESAAPFPAPEARLGPDLPLSAKGVSSVLIDYFGRAFVVVRDDLNFDPLASIQQTSLKARAPVLFTPAMFRFFIRQYEPQQYTYFTDSRTIAFGLDPLPNCEPPTLEQIEGSLLDQIPNALLFPRGSELFGGQDEAPFSGAGAALRRFLPILMVQSGRFNDGQLRHVLQHCRRFGAAEFGRLEQLALTPPGPGPTAQWELFLLFKKLSAKILEGTRR